MFQHACSTPPWPTSMTTDKCGGCYREEEGVWCERLVADSSAVDWVPGQPHNSAGQEHCIFLHINTRQSDYHRCNTNYCPLCRIAELTAFHLQGICQNSFIDRFYVMKSPTLLLGYLTNKIVCTEERRRWEIINSITNRTDAFMNETFVFPFGTHPWYFMDGSHCTDSDLA